MTEKIYALGRLRRTILGCPISAESLADLVDLFAEYVDFGLVSGAADLAGRISHYRDILFDGGITQ